MAQEGNTVVSAPSKVNGWGVVVGEDAQSKRPRVDHPWRSTSKCWEAPSEGRWWFGYGWSFERERDNFGRPLVIGPHRLYERWFEHNNGFQWFPVPIECTDFPNISDEDLFYLLRAIERCHHYAQPGSYYCDCPFTEGEMKLYQSSIVLASKRALEGLTS